MALFPCSVCHQRYGGPQQSVYPAIVNGSVSERAHLRLCPRHLDPLLEWLRKHTSPVVADEAGPTMFEFERPCSICGEADPTYQLFANVYLRGQEPLLFWTRFCEKHSGEVAKAVHL
jgi:hypothetical protein